MDLGALPSGLSLTFATESFAVRALLGSLAAVALSATLIGLGVVRSLRARRALVLAPVAAAVVAAVTSVGEAFLPQVRVASSALEGGRILEYVGEYRSLTGGFGIDVLLVVYALITTLLIGRRLAGLATWRRLLAPARPAPEGDPLRATAADLSHRLGIAPPPLLLLPGCPGGAFTGGLRRPVIVVDPALLDGLDEAEREGLLAHELAHVARRDAAVGLAAGLVRDLDWFLVPLHLGAAWLRREQEEGADEAASAVTGRPAALASGLLKVFDRSRAPAPRVACAMASTRGGAWWRRGRAKPGSNGFVAARIERLIARKPAPGPVRRRVEAGVVCASIALAAVATVGVPSWIASDLATEELALLYLSGSAVTATAEAPALQTFRALAPAESAGDDGAKGPEGIEHTRTTATAGADALERVGEPTRQSAARVETRAEMETGVLRDEPRERLTWGDAERQPWELGPPGEVSEARPLVSTRNETGAEVGVFALSSEG